MRETIVSRINHWVFKAVCITLSATLWACAGTGEETSGINRSQSAVEVPSAQTHPMPVVASESTGETPPDEDIGGAGDGGPFILTSPAFREGDPIPARYSCEGEDVSPELAWSGAPPATVSYVLLLEDPDAPGGTWDHWVLYNLPAGLSDLAEAVPSDGQFPAGGLQGENSWGRIGYGGPCPPGGTHRYVFTLYALDTLLDSPAGVRKDEVLAALEGHILGQTVLVGTFTR